MICYLSRTEHFSSAHRLNSSRLTADENALVYGKCNSLNGHGHNYTLTVTLRGPVSPITGMVVNLVDVKASLQRVISILDHKHLDLDVIFFKDTPSTVENVCVFIWEVLKDCRLIGSLIYRVRVEETASNACEYMGETS